MKANMADAGSKYGQTGNVKLLTIKRGFPRLR